MKMETSISSSNHNHSESLSPGKRKKKKMSFIPKSKFKMLKSAGRKKRKDGHDNGDQNHSGGGGGGVGRDDHVPNNITTRTTTNTTTTTTIAARDTSSNRAEYTDATNRENQHHNQNHKHHHGDDDNSIQQQSDLSTLQNVLSNDEFIFTPKFHNHNDTKGNHSHDNINNNISNSNNKISPNNTNTDTMNKLNTLSFDTVQTAPPRLEPRVLYDVHHQQHQHLLGQRHPNPSSSASSVSSLSTSMSRNYRSISARRINTAGDDDDADADDDDGIGGHGHGHGRDNDNDNDNLALDGIDNDHQNGTTTTTKNKKSSIQDEAEDRQDLVKRAIFNSVKLRRLEELKRYQQYDHENCYKYLLKEYKDNDALSSPPASPTISPNGNNNYHDNTTPTTNMNNNNNNNNSITNSLHGSSHSVASSHRTQGSISPPSTSSSQSQSSTTRPPSAMSSWETTRHTLTEDYLMTFINKSPYRITFTAMFFMILLYVILSIDSTAASFMGAGAGAGDADHLYDQYGDVMIETTGTGNDNDSVENMNITAAAAAAAGPAATSVKTTILQFIPHLFRGKNDSQGSTIGETVAATEGSDIHTTDTSALLTAVATILQLLSSVFGALLSKSHVFKRIFKNIIAFGMEIFATNMKTFVFVILYGILLDIIFISAFDNVNIPIIVSRLKSKGEPEIVREERVESDSNDQGSANSTISGSSSESGTVIEGKKNPIIRQFVIENIRKATAAVALCIVGCGLVKGVLYTLLYHFICTVDYLYSFCALVKDSMIVSVLSSFDDGDTVSSDNNTRGGVIVTRSIQKLVEWNEQIVQIPLKIIGILLRIFIRPLCYYSGVSWMCNSFYTSIIASSSLSICTQIIDVVKNLMMYIGVFVLTFYLILVHIYPEKILSSGAASGEVSKSTTECDNKEEEEIRTQ